MTSPWRPRIGLADSVALLAASGLTITVATPLGVQLGVVTPPSDLEAFEQVVDSLPVAPLLPKPEARPWVQFTDVPAGPSSPPAPRPSSPPALRQSASDPELIRASESGLRSPPTSALHQTGSSVLSTPLGQSRLSLHRADVDRRSRYRASLGALQRLSRRPTVELPAGSRSVTEHPIVRLPLLPGRESWQATRDLVLSGHLPHPELVRVESFVGVASEGTHRAPSQEDPVGLGFELAAASEGAGTLLLQVHASGPDQLAQERAPV